MNFNNSQRLGLDIDRHIALDAGAGTGKTTVMAHRYVQHILSHNQRATRLLPPAAKIPLKGLGALRCPARERTEIKNWQGLLPTETVAITFTKKAASELKGRIRKLISRLRASPPKKGDIHGFHDARISEQGDIEMLLSLIEDAPISTIDSFLSSIVSPWLGLVSENPGGEQISEEDGVLLREEAIRTAWRLQRGTDAIEVGMQGDVDEFLNARNRLSVRLGGQYASSTVIRGLMKRSLFVEEASKSMGNRGRNIKSEDLDHLFVNPTEDILDHWYSSFRSNIEDWIETWLDGGSHFVTGADNPSGMTRFRYVQHLCTMNSDSRIWKLQWIWLVSHAIAPVSHLNKMYCKPLFRASPPNSQGWPSGLLSKTANKTMSKDVKEIITTKAESISQQIRGLMNTPDGLLLRSLGNASFLLNPVIEEPIPIDGQTAYPPRLPTELPQLPPAKLMRLQSDLEIEVIQDLFTVNKGVQEILSYLKSSEGVADFDDMHRFAEDLLLTRCPAVCRTWYPKPVIDALDSIGDKPWLDDHLHRAIAACKKGTEVHTDLMRRITLVRQLRRSYRAFIIDEYQDTNPQHFRLLSRLWGRRQIEDDELRPPAGEWDPTICIVGDMKQSIYRFRQAELTVMRRAVDIICTMNEQESAMEHRLDDLKKSHSARDPRPIPGSRGSSTSFVQSAKLLSQDAKREEWVSFTDGDGSEKIDSISIQRRSKGHIEMRTNHRTLPTLLNTMNYVFQDTFSTRHHMLPGPWHAESQDLLAGRESDREPMFEWIIPTTQGYTELSRDLNVPINPFENPESTNRDLANQLLAKRLVSLFSTQRARVKDFKNDSWTDVSSSGHKIMPEDVMILVSSRGRIPSILEVLEEHGIPAVADKQGILLERPAVRTLMSMLWLACNPSSKAAALEVGQSCIVGLDDSILHNHLMSSSGNQIEALSKIAPTPQLSSLLTRLAKSVFDNDILGCMNLVVDHSDLLRTYPREGDRQDIDNWLSLFENNLEKEGGDAALALLRLRELEQLGTDGPQSTSAGTSGAVQVMTIHASKGLESPIVVLYDIFNIGTKDTTLSSRDNVLVTPEMIAARIHPWRGASKPQSGLWTLAYMMDKGQRLAERRRQFYVALTRARDRLIVVGAPEDSVKIGNDGCLNLSRKGGQDNMGYMLLDGLAHASIQAGNQGCVWSNGGLDQQSETLSINPSALLNDGYLPNGCVSGIAVFHHPSCFDIQPLISPLSKWQDRLERLENSSLSEPKQDIRSIVHEVNLPSHSLDTAWKCKRSHWLSMRMNWRPEPLNFIPTKSVESYWPSATEFGSLFHRLLEIGLPNPGIGSENLDRTWTEHQPNRLLDEKTMEEVLAQSSFNDQKLTKRVRERMMKLAKLVDIGVLGKLTKGGEFDAMTLEGLRTELPFNFQHESRDEIIRERWTPMGNVPVTKIYETKCIFDGRADLVIALKDRDNNSWLQVVDAKTSGCLSSFNDEDFENGHELQLGTGLESPYAETKSEREILNKHRLQLTLYCLALEANEAGKPKDLRRRILPPAILIAASGRMVRMQDEDYENAKSDLHELISWMGHISAVGEEYPAPKCSSPGNCEACVFFNGTIKLHDSDQS